ncbi:MAG: lysophospholipid acyltransferase family protein [Halioglobus sp.]|nr:lysophospholipid acyltransferase family protein [Halioglobus sp.]
MPQFYLIPKRLARKAPWLVLASQRVEAQGFRLVFWIMRRLSVERACRLSAFLFRLVGPHSDKARKARINLAIAFPDSSPQWRDQTTAEIFGHLGNSAAELIKLEQIWEQRAERLEFVLQSGARAHIEANGPTVFVTAHIGAWQVTNLIGLQYGLTISTIYAAESNPILRDAMLELRQSFGVRLIASDAGVRPLIRELTAGHSIGMAMDTRLDTGTLIPFFGREALTNTTAARLALRTGAALIPIRAERLPQGRFRITAYDPLNCDNPQASSDEQAVELTARINRCFETWIREAPAQWICLKRRWPKASKL